MPLLTVELSSPYWIHSSRMAPPPVAPLQPGHHQRSSPTSSSVHQQQQQPPQPGYPTVPVGSLDERSAKHQRVDDGLSPSRLSVAQWRQQLLLLGYPIQQYQRQTHTHWYGSGAQPTHAPVSQPSQPTYGYSSASSAGPSYS